MLPQIINNNAIISTNYLFFEVFKIFYFRGTFLDSFSNDSVEKLFATRVLSTTTICNMLCIVYTTILFFAPIIILLSSLYVTMFVSGGEICLNKLRYNAPWSTWSMYLYCSSYNLIIITNKSFQTHNSTVFI